MSHVIQRECFAQLDAPVEVLSSVDIPIPFSAELERGFLANNRLEMVIKSLVEY
jgi:2-oxoisovalerate dehydrogenase E1 component